MRAKTDLERGDRGIPLSSRRARLQRSRKDDADHDRRYERSWSEAAERMISLPAIHANSSRPSLASETGLAPLDNGAEFPADGYEPDSRPRIAFTSGSFGS